jgi:hypothetical protein
MRDETGGTTADELVVFVIELVIGGQARAQSVLISEIVASWKDL